MSNLAADFIEKVANSSMTDARKKLPDLVWSQGSMLEYLDWDEKTNKVCKPCACALGIGELAACNKPNDIQGSSLISDIPRSHLGRKGAFSTMKLEWCPFTIKGKRKLPCKEEFVEINGKMSAENVVVHINDNHATSWIECKKMLRQIAKLERKAVAKAKKHVA